MSNHLNQYLTYRALAQRFEHRDLVDRVLSSSASEGISIEGQPIKNMCAKVPAQLVEKVDAVCRSLDISKRDFIEMAVAGAIEDALALMDEYEIPEVVRVQKEAAA